MKIKHSLLFALGLTISFGANAYSDSDFTSGVFILNEDWYGHQNSTLNMWYPDDDDPYMSPVRYRIFQSENSGMEIGCTAQFGQIFGGKLYIMSKQYQDPGAKIAGGRITVIDASNMKCLFQSKTINPNGVAEEMGDSQSGTITGSALGDGRACCGVTPDKIYLGTSNGIYIPNPTTYAITGPISGTENELVSSGDNNIDGQGPLYQNQIGVMIRTQDYVFAIKQDYGILCIDPVTDTVVHNIPGCFSTMVQAADGSIWAGMNLADPNETNEFGVPLNHYPYGTNGDAWDGGGLLRIDPYTLETKQVKLYLGGVPQSWYAWTAGKLTASAKRNVLYFTYSDPTAGQGGWFSDCMLYRYDIDRDWTDRLYNSSIDGLWFYSSSLRVNPVDDKLYCHFYVGSSIANQDWVYIRYTDEGSTLENDAEWKLIKNYWYPAMFIFPDRYAPVVSETMPSVISVGDKPVTIDLADKVTDRDTPAVSIVKRIIANTNPEAVEASLVKGNLVLKSLGKGTAEITVQFDSNGLTVNHTISVNATSALPVLSADSDTPTDIRVYNLKGALIGNYRVAPSEMPSLLPPGIYILHYNNLSKKLIIN